MKMTRLCFLAAAALAAGCATPPDHFHTLRPAVGPAPAGAREAPRVLAIGPVTVPDSLARDEWVIRNGDTGAMVYDHQLWTQSLGADVAQSLADYLDRGPLPDGLWADAGPTGSGSGADLERPAPLRVRVQVLRFDSMLSPVPAVADQVRWTIECLPSDPALGPVDAGRYRVVRTAVRDAAGPAPAATAGVEESQQRFDRVARAHSDTVRRVAEDVAAALRASAAERAQSCVPAR
jgi:uncharacterized lipoprotein YmbA